MMNHTEKVPGNYRAPRRLGAGVACILLGTLVACGGGGGSDAGVAAGGGGAAQLAETAVVGRSDPLVQSANPATMKLAERNCVKHARTEAGDGAARKSVRHNARKESCESAFEEKSAG